MKKIVLGVILTGLVLMSTSITFAESNMQKELTEKIFTDLSGHWSAKAVQSLLKKEAIPYDQDKFIPDKAITKSEFAIMLHKALDIQINYFTKPDVKDYFDDIQENDPFALTVIDLVNAGVFEGKGSFKPQDSIPREEMVYYIMGAYRYMRGEKYQNKILDFVSFKDTNEIAPQYIGEVAMAQHYNLIVGSGDNKFHPKKLTTRAEAAVVINKLVNLLDQQNRLVTIKPDAVLSMNSIEMKLSIANNTSKDVIINHSSGQKYDFELLDEDKNILYKWSADRDFIAALTNTVIEPGQTHEFTEILTGEDFTDIKDRIVYLRAYIMGKSDFLEIRRDGYETKVR